VANKVYDKDNLPGIIASIKSLQGRSVEAGIFGPEAEEQVEGSSISLLALANILHEGCSITVTPKMRSYLHSLGLHLKASTTQITIPARPFIDPVMEEADGEVVEILRKAINGAIDGGGGGDLGTSAWNKVGLYLVTAIKKSMVDLREPANHPFTIKQKGSENPLIDHGHLTRSVVHEVKVTE